MPQRLSRRSFALASMAAVAAPVFIRSARADEPLRLRLSLDTAPSAAARADFPHPSSELAP